MKRYINDPLHADWTEQEFRVMKWCDPAGHMTVEELEREGDGDWLLGRKRVQARFLGLPEPYVIDDGIEDEDPAAEAAFHKALLTSHASDVPGFHVGERDSLMMTALRYSQLHPDEWRQYVRRWNLDERKLRRVYGVE